MPLPTGTGLTAHFDFSDGSLLWKNYDASPPYHLNAIADGFNIQDAQDVEGGDLSAISNIGPIWRENASSPMLRSCAEFSTSFGAGMAVGNDAHTVAYQTANYVPTTGSTWLVAFRVTSCSSNSSLDFQNDALWADANGYCGAHLRFDGTDLWLQWYSYVAPQVHVELPILFNTDYVARGRDDTTDLHLSLNGGSETSIAGGTRAGGGDFFVAKNAAASSFNGYLGELAFFDNDLGATHGAETTWFTDGWLAGSTPTSAHNRQQMFRNRAAVRASRY